MSPCLYIYSICQPFYHFLSVMFKSHFLPTYFHSCFLWLNIFYASYTGGILTGQFSLNPLNSAQNQHPKSSKTRKLLHDGKKFTFHFAKLFTHTHVVNHVENVHKRAYACTHTHSYLGVNVKKPIYIYICVYVYLLYTHQWLLYTYTDLSIIYVYK